MQVLTTFSSSHGCRSLVRFAPQPPALCVPGRVRARVARPLPLVGRSIPRCSAKGRGYAPTPTSLRSVPARSRGCELPQTNTIACDDSGTSIEMVGASVMDVFYFCSPNHYAQGITHRVLRRKIERQCSYPNPLFRNLGWKTVRTRIVRVQRIDSEIQIALFSKRAHSSRIGSNVRTECSLRRSIRLGSRGIRYSPAIDSCVAIPDDGFDFRFLVNDRYRRSSQFLPIFKRPPQPFVRQGIRAAEMVLAHGHSVQFPSLPMVKKHKDVSNTKLEGTPEMENVATDAAAATKRQPIKTIRIDDCSVSIWARVAMIRGETVTFYSMSFERSYKDRDGSNKYTKSFDSESLGKIVTLCQQASEAIESLQQ